MRELWSMYHEEIPSFIEEFMNTKEMKRLEHIGMNCGVDYTSFPLFKEIGYYTRFDHSVSCALIIYHMTHSMKEAIAGLFHDIASPCFAHTIDFMMGDYETQEATESRTREIIEHSEEIQSLLKKYNLHTDDVSDYHNYPVADNDAPRLSADRLEYTLGNLVNFGYATKETVQSYYEHIFYDEEQEELVFNDQESAVAFTKDMLKASRVYVCDGDRYAMEALAQLMKQAITLQVITIDDLYTREDEVISKLCKHPVLQQKWDTYCNLSKTVINDGGYKISAKKRYIDPLCGSKRVSELDASVKIELNMFINTNFDYFVRGL